MSSIPITKISGPMVQSTTPSENQTGTDIEQTEVSHPVMPSSSPKISQWQTSLSGDVAVLISIFLTPNDFANAMMVCEIWKNQLSEHAFWKWRANRLGISTAVKDNIPKSLQEFLRDYQSDGITTNDTSAGFNDRVNGIIFEYYVHAKDVLAQRPTIAFGREEWIKYFGVDPGREPPLPGDIHEILKGPSFFQGKTVEQTSVLVYIPAKVTKIIDGSSVNITIRSLGDLAKSSGNTDYVDIDSSILRVHGDKATEKGRWVLMTNDVLPGSRNIPYNLQQELVRAKPGYKVPKLVDVVAVCFLVNACSKQRLLSGDTPQTFTRTDDEIFRYKMVFGWPLRGPIVHCLTPLYYNNNFGIVAMREF